jgi:hypothetical protein
MKDRLTVWLICFFAIGHHRIKEDMSQTVNRQAVQIIFGEIEFESAPEVPDFFFDIIPVKRRY